MNPVSDKMVQPVLIWPAPCPRLPTPPNHGLARNDATRVTGTRSSSACLSTALSVCLPAYLFVHLSACLSICVSGCKSIQADAAVRLSLHSAVGLSVSSAYLSACPFVRLPFYLPICLSTYLSACLCICPSVCLSVLLSVLSVCLSTREMGHTGHTIQRCRTETGTTVPRAARCGVSPSADVPGMNNDRVMNIFVNRKVIQ